MGFQISNPDGSKEQLKTIPGFLTEIATSGDVHTLIFSGADLAGKPETWTVQTSTNQDSFINALESVPYVYYAGHANDGAGFSLKKQTNSPSFNPENVQSIDHFMHLRNPRVAVPWRQLKEGEGEYINFGPGAIPANYMPAHPANYPVPVQFSKPIIDGLGFPNSERFPNNDSTLGAYDHVHPGEILTLQGVPTKIDQYHMNRLGPPGDNNEAGEDIPFLVVDVDNSIKPRLSYKIFFACVCYRARDYSEVFHHGYFISAIGVGIGDDRTPIIYVDALVHGGSVQTILEGLKQYQGDDFARSIP